MKRFLLILMFLTVLGFVFAQQQHINIGTSANDGTGDPLRTAFDKINDNFDELYARPYGSSYWKAYGSFYIEPDPVTKIIRYPAMPTYIPTSQSIGKLKPVYYSPTLKTLATIVDIIGPPDDTISTENHRETYVFSTASANDTVYVDSIKNLCGSFTILNNGPGSSLTLLSIDPGVHFDTAHKVVLNYKEWVKITPDSVNSVFITTGNTLSDSANPANKSNVFNQIQTFEKGIIYTPMVIDSVMIDGGLDSLSRIIIYDDHNDSWYTYSGGAACPITDGVTGEMITVISRHEGRLFLNHNQYLLKEDADFEMSCGDNITLIYVDGEGWIEISRTDRPYDCLP